ncbi:MAG: peptidylprolyl isomerase [Bacteroidales bacterium]|jgi:peptidyl-prolyl cis-trans isomerase SurA|nr:peptidylprolyl isomerase [Bacteroidales bacterium]
MKRRLLTLAVILAGGLQLMAQEAENIIDEIIWVVGDEAILRSEVENERKRMLYQGEKIDGDPYGVIPEQMAIQKLFINQAIIDSIEVSDEQVEAQVDAQMNMFIAQIGSKEKLEEYLEKPISQLRSEWRTGIRNNAIMQQMQQKLVEDVTITPSEVRLYFERLPKDSIPFIETQVEVQIITLQPQVSKQQVDEIKNRLRDFTNRVNSGESEFSTLAILYSEDPGSAAMGGELGFKAKGAYVPEFSAVAFQLTEPGKVSKVVETEFGYHIIQLIERRGDRANFRHILLTPKVSAKELTDARARMDTLRMDLDSAKFTFEEAARYLSSDKNTRNSGGMMTSERSGAARMTMDELPAEVARVVARMEVGEISKPFVMKDSKTSRDQVAIVKLKRRIPGHKATYYDDYQTVKEIYEQHLHQEIIENFIREKQKTTYVRIKPGWEKYDFKYPGWGQRE